MPKCGSTTINAIILHFMKVNSFRFERSSIYHLHVLDDVQTEGMFINKFYLSILYNTAIIKARTNTFSSGELFEFICKIYVQSLLSFKKKNHETAENMSFFGMSERIIHNKSHTWCSLLKQSWIWSRNSLSPYSGSNERTARRQSDRWTF